MRKIAIFVEGQTELIFVREFIRNIFSYNVDIECYRLFREGNLENAEYPCKCPNADAHYTIINVGNDAKVPTAICDRAKSYFSKGYEKIVGLRDMYSRKYKEKTNIIDPNINKAFIELTEEIVKLRSKEHHVNIHICFSIMEIESWFLAMHDVFERIHPDLDIESIKNKLGIDLPTINPEKEIFHPAEEVANIYELACMPYEKHKGDIESFCSKLSYDDYSKLYQSDSCMSFNYFYDKVI